jgi:two-component system, cell cycle response regulator DivK
VLPAAPRTVTRQGARTVLVVEDDVRDQAQLVSTLASAGYAVEIASTGAEALSQWRTRPFDAVTIDLLLPDMTGIDLLVALRGEGHQPSVPIIVVTVVPDAKVVAGFAIHDILPKPIDRDRLVASLVRAGVRGTNIGLVTTNPPHILIVDDNPTNLKLVTYVVKEQGYDVATALEAEAALARIRVRVPQLILMDLQLPGIDGLELTRRLKADPATRHIIIIAVTAYAMKGDRDKALAAGCDDYVTKPIDTRTLPDVIARHVSRVEPSA